MKVRLGANVEVDLLNASEVRSELEAFRKAIREDARKAKGNIRTIEAKATTDTNGAVVINLGAPAAGKAWDVRRLNVTGQDPNTALAGKALVYRGSDTVNPMNFVDTGGLPNVGTWSAHQFTVRQDENVLLRIVGGPASTDLFASGQVLEADYDQLYGAKAI